jgi:hypothetical protein
MSSDPRKERLRKISRIFWGALLMGVLSAYTSSFFAGLTSFLARSETGEGFFEYYIGIVLNYPTYAFSAFMCYGGLLLISVSVMGLIVISIRKLTGGVRER